MLLLCCYCGVACSSGLFCYCVAIVLLMCCYCGVTCSGGFAGVEEVDVSALKHSHVSNVLEASHRLAPGRMFEVGVDVCGQF